MHNKCMGLNGNLTKRKMHPMKKSDRGLKVIFSQKIKNKSIFYEKMKTQVHLNTAVQNFFFFIYTVLMKIIIKFRYNAHSDWLEKHG